MIQVTSEALERLVAEAEAARRNRDLARAERLYLEVCRANQRHPAALAGLGHIYRDAARPDLAVTLFREALACGNGEVSLWNELGRVLVQVGRPTEAVEVFRKAVALRPDDAESWNDLGMGLDCLQRREEALAAFDRAIALCPDHVPALNNRGGALRALGRLSEALESFGRAMAANPRVVEIDNNRAETLLMMGRQEEALAAYQRLIAVRPQLRCARDGYLYALQMVEHDDPRLVFQEHQRWDRDFGIPLARFILPHANDRTRERRLRVGYISSDLRAHPVAYFVENLLEHHDRTAVEVFCYAGVSHGDATTERLRKKTDHWREVQGHSDDRLAALVRDDAIDILVDLNGHTMGSRLTTFARKPAPVQVTYLGYPATTGLSAIDYRLTDAHADPLGEADALHSEKLVRLPETFLCWRAPDESPPACVRDRNFQGITFASFNALPKVSAFTIALWATILGSRPDARLVIKAIGLNDAGTRQGLLEKFARHGIADNRLVLVDRFASLERHLAYYQQVDVALDTTPYGGTTTTCEALWMGVPVVTLAGKVHAGRVGVSILNNLGLGDLVAGSAQQYVARALSVAADAARRQELRAGLRERMKRSPLMDAVRFAHAVEQAYRQMWHGWCAGGAVGKSAS